MELVKRLVVIFCVSLFALGIVACEKEGAAEKAGKKVDSAFDAAKKKADDLTKQVWLDRTNK